jgi:hypothetical protein
MRHDTIEVELPKRRAHRIWYGHGSSRLIADDSANLPAYAIDAAIADFTPVKFPATATANLRTDDHHPLPASLIANLTAQLESLDRDRERMANLLRHAAAIAGE